MQICRSMRLRVVWAAVLVLTGNCCGEERVAVDWQQQMREHLANRQLDAALATVNQRLEYSPADLEAHGWRGRILAWQGCWTEAEFEYRSVLQSAPSDVDILTSLADVLVWQEKTQDALQFLDRARLLSPSNPEILTRRAKVLLILGQTADARAEFRQVLALDPGNQEARKVLKGIATETRHEFRVGEDVDTFNYTDAAQAQSLTLASRWSPRWSTVFATSVYQRFGENAAKGTASATFRITQKDWATVGGSGADDHGVIPRSEVFCEYGHGFRFQNLLFRGLEASYRQHWLWYRGAHVLTMSLNQLFYLPHDWTWALTVTGARSGFGGTGVEWAPSGSTKLGLPLLHRLTGNVSFAVGSENFAQVDQIGRFSARTFGGGLRFRIADNQDISGYMASQERSQSRSQNSFGLSYGIHF